MNNLTEQCHTRNNNYIVLNNASYNFYNSKNRTYVTGSSDRWKEQNGVENN